MAYHAVTPAATDSSQGGQSSVQLGLLDHILMRTPHLLADEDRCCHSWLVLPCPLHASLAARLYKFVLKMPSFARVRLVGCCKCMCTPSHTVLAFWTAWVLIAPAGLQASVAAEKHQGGPAGMPAAGAGLGPGSAARGWGAQRP